MQAGQAALPTLQAQAAGQPTAGTRAIQQQVGAATTRAQQAYGASARRASGTAVGTPPRAQLGRLQAAGIQGLTQELGTAQRQATQTLAGIGVGAAPQMRAIETEKRQAYGQMVGDLGTIYAEYQNMQAAKEEDAWMKEMYTELINAFKLFGSEMGAQGAGTPQAPARTEYWDPGWGEPRPL